MRNDRKFDVLALGLAICAVPLSIAVAEIFLCIALLARLVQLRKGLALPRVAWIWLVWAGLAVIAWLQSPDLKAGLGEMRHLLLIAALFVIVPALDRPVDAVTIWRGLFVTATIGSISLIAVFAYRLVHYRRELATVSDPSFYLRTGGLLHHWMIYGTVEILVLAGLLQFWSLYPEQRRRLVPILAINAIAIYLSLTRTLWLSGIVILSLHLLWRRSKWAWALPVLPLALFVIAPAGVRARITESFRPSYYSNAERLQMLRVGWKMIKDAPLTGIGPGRVNGTYTRYLAPGDPVPAYHGHLHDNFVQVAAEFGLPVSIAAAAFTLFLFLDLRRSLKTAPDRDTVFLSRTGMLGLAGYLTAGLFEYTYGHALGLILLSFVVLAPIVLADRRAARATKSQYPVMPICT